MPVSKFLLENLNSSKDSPSPNDKILIMINGTNASGTQNVTLSDYFEDAADVYYVQLKHVTVASGIIASAAAVPGDVAVTTLIIGNPQDFKQL